MPDQIYIGEFSKGFTTNPLPFNIDNDAFPTMYNFYSWRKRAKRKRGTIFLGQLQRQLKSVASPNNWQVGAIGVLGGGGAFSGNLITIFSLQAGSTIVPGSITLSDGTNTYTEPTAPNGLLVGAPGGSGTINYATGAIAIAGGVPGATLVGTFSYYPGLPVMGLRDFVVSVATSIYPALLAFDTVYAYQINDSLTNGFYSVSYYKTSNNPVTWSGQDYQQFWTTNYSGALWASNNNPGMQFEVINTIVVGNPTTITTTGNHGLVTGDYVWFNEITGADANLLNQIAAQITVTGATSFTVPINTTGKAINNSGIFQTLTAKSPTSSGDGLRWYDGDMTNKTGIPIAPPTNTGWVNFAPPLTIAAGGVSIDNLPAAKYYLVGALAIVPFKDRLVFLAPYVQTSTGSPILLQDTAIWSWNGTPYYTVDSTGAPILVPVNQTANATAYCVDQTGKGGWLAAGLDQPIVTVNRNEDVLLVEFGRGKTRFVYTGDDIFPFAFFLINSELGASATFSNITLDRGGIAVGRQGITLTTQQSAERIDIDIPDSVFQISAQNNGVQRVNSARDFFKEWMYFSFPPNVSLWKFPTQTLMWNYRDDTWALFYENFTAHGTYRKGGGPYTWKTIPFPTWSQWQEAWNSGSTSPLFPSVIAGNPQGYVLIKGQGTGEGISGTILAISANGGNSQITSNNHCVQLGDYLYFQNAISSTSTTITGITNANPAVVTSVNTYAVGQYVQFSEVVGMTQINGKTLQIIAATGTSFTVNWDTSLYGAYVSGGLATVAPLQNQIGMVISVVDANNFVVDIPFISVTYEGLGNYSRLSQPLLQTKQFPFYWNEGRQTRLAAQKYLMDRTVQGQVTVNIYLSQDPTDAWNAPSTNPLGADSSLVYSQLMFTCPESNNIGLTPANTNLQMPTAANQFQIWHRMNTSLIGDTVQIGITLSDAQMRNYAIATSEISLHGMVLSVEKGPQLS